MHISHVEKHGSAGLGVGDSRPAPAPDKVLRFLSALMVSLIREMAVSSFSRSVASEDSMEMRELEVNLAFLEGGEESEGVAA